MTIATYFSALLIGSLLRNSASTASNSDCRPNETSWMTLLMKNVGVARTPLRSPPSICSRTRCRWTLVLHCGVVAHHVKLEPLRVSAQLFELQVILVLEQQVMHRPELVLGCCRFRRERGMQRVRMNLYERKVAIDNLNASGETCQQQFHNRCSLLAIRTFEVAVLD